MIDIINEMPQLQRNLTQRSQKLIYLLKNISSKDSKAPGCRMVEVGALAATAKYLSVLARKVRLQIFATKTCFLQVHIFVLCYMHLWWCYLHLWWWRKPLRNLGFCIKLASSAWNHVLHGDTWFKALGAGLSRNKSWYGRFGVPVVTKTLAKPWILHQTCAKRLESCITWWYIIQTMSPCAKPRFFYVFSTWYV